ncbi:hypothetical protein [Streptomyces orinoci]|uniref:Uncharacterized protein n=1 Tax=Streptomyces orinoci TaxID=67339 RepID=A0ABV3K4N8_STRON|nr:hypothetical protein [Streptomyces orinoci]
MTRISALWQIASSTETEWLVELCKDEGTTGFPPPGMPDAAWVLNAMYEHQQGPGLVSHHEVRQAGLADGSIEPDSFHGIDLEVGTVTGGRLGRAEHPGPGWRRLRWAELARRTGDPVVKEGYWPSRRSVPDGRMEDRSWPVSIVPPTEGSLDRETWNRLIEILQEYSPAGPDTRCLAYYNPLMMGDFDNLHVLSGRLGDARALYDMDEPDFSPSNLWPEDRSWIVYTDYDLWGTKVVGPTALLDTLVGDTEIEAVRLPWAS